MTRRALVLMTAAAIDALLGEPPAALHPVVWLGRVVALLERRAPAEGPVRQAAWGAAVAGSAPLAAAMLGVAVTHGGRRLGTARLPWEAAWLSTAFAVRGLLTAGDAVRTPLARGDIAPARAALRSLVSRDTAALSPALIAAAAIESLAENVTDGFLAPWLAYLAFGLPGAFAYRAVNTLDSMVGYRGRYEYLGKAAARLDDAVNVIPSRVAAALLSVCAGAGGGSPRAALAGAWRGRRRTASPNAGWTMGAMAGALGLRLEKPGAYTLGAGRAPRPADIRQAQYIVVAVAATALAAVGLAAGVRAARERS